MGFVSNSSSSSFMLMMPKEKHDAILKDFNSDFLSAVVDSVTESGKFLGHDIVCIYNYSDRCGYGPFEFFSYDGDDKEGQKKYENAYEAYRAYLSVARKEKDVNFEISLDW
jgi:hypothetical protein